MKLENNSFDELRKELLSKATIMTDIKNFEETFDLEFFKLIEYCNFSLMDEEDNFFASFMLSMDRKIKWELSTATGITANLTSFTIFFNPYIFLSCSLNEMKALIKHDIYHILNRHLIRERRLRGKYSNLAINLAMDISINGYIKNLPLWAESLKNVKASYNVDLPDEATVEEYAALIQGALDKKKRSKKFGDNDAVVKDHEIEKAHDLWNQGEELMEINIDELTKKAVAKISVKKIPFNVENLIGEINREPKISWSAYLKRLASSTPSGNKKVSTRRNRRQPDRLELRGTLTNHKANVVVALDISGSMTNNDIEAAMAEIFSIVKNITTHITIVECDSEIRRIYKAKSQRDLIEKVDTKGGTKFSPVFEYMNKHKKNNILIYFTDGEGEKELSVTPLKYKTLWVLSGKESKLSLKNTIGTIKNISEEKIEEKEDILYMKNQFKDSVWIWADSAVL